MLRQNGTPRESTHMQLLLFVCLIAVALAVQLPNPIPLFDVTGAAMNVHDGDIRQWVPGGPYYYYGMAYDRCKFIACGDPTCGHLMDHRVRVWRSATLANRSWELVGDALPGSAGGAYGTLYRPHVLFNAPTRLYVLFVNLNTHNGSDDRWRNMAATSASPEGPFTAVNEMAQLTYGKRNGHNLGDFGVFHDDDGDRDGYICLQREARRNGACCDAAHDIAPGLVGGRDTRGRASCQVSGDLSDHALWAPRRWGSSRTRTCPTGRNQWGSTRTCRRWPALPPEGR